MKPIPVLVHIGPVQLHTYGLGLAITFYVAYRFLERRLRDNGYPYSWVPAVTGWVILAALIGARAAHVAAHPAFYIANPLQIPEVWHGGLSSFGGLIFGVPTGFILARRRAPEIPGRTLADLVAPVLIGAWALGRLLGPQLMVAGGGHPTHEWFGMYYADQVGKRLPVPIFQAAISLAILLVAWRVERYVSRGGPHGLVMSATIAFWGLGRFFEEHLWLAYRGNAGAIAVQVAGVCLCAAGTTTSIWLLTRGQRTRHAPPEQPVARGEPVLNPER